MKSSKILNRTKVLLTKLRGRLGLKNLRGNSFYKGHRDIAKKASIPLKKHLKCLEILENASISLKKLKK
jgi:hypothetical protein